LLNLFIFLFASLHDLSTYNADFDGDEINVHFPQDEISRAEAYNIVNANNQYVKPTSGDPIRALIQVFAYIIKKHLDPNIVGGQERMRCITHAS